MVLQNGFFLYQNFPKLPSSRLFDIWQQVFKTILGKLLRLVLGVLFWKTVRFRASQKAIDRFEISALV
jgi:hypothetical protein